MSEELTAVLSKPIEQTAHFQGGPALPNDGAPLYRCRRQGEASGGVKFAGAPVAAAKDLSAATYGEKYLTGDGQVVPCTLSGLVEFQVAGFIVVLVLMVGLYLISAALSRMIAPLLQSPLEPIGPTVALPPGPISAPPLEVAGMHPGLSNQQLVVLLTAAAFEVMGTPVRVDRILQLNVADSNWTVEGRSVLHSHRLN